MRKFTQRGAYAPAATASATTSTHNDMLYRQQQQQQRGNDERSRIQQLSFEDEMPPYVGYPQPHPHPTTAEQQYLHSWQQTNDSINARQAQEAPLDFNNNNQTTATLQRRLQRPAWQRQKLHRSYNNLSSLEYGSSGAGSTPSAEFHHMGMWRENDDIPVEMHDADVNRARLHSDSGGNHSYCNIGNCGKILWISRDPHAQQGIQQHAAATKLSNGTSTTKKNYSPSPGIIVRTNAQGLPYTPPPHQRQAYLANQHAIEAAIPLVVNGIGEGRRTKSPSRYFESDVNIHYKTPIRYEYKEPIPEEELAIRQAEQMQKLYQEERRRKYLQELQDMNSRRHTDNFTPSQKSPIPLNRYDDFQSDLAPKSPNTALYAKIVARALYNFQGQTARELSFRKGDIIYIRRQIDKNWYEGEHNAMIGLLPANYVEIISKDGLRQPARKPSEGQARAKYNFQAQSGIELSLNKGELVTLTRRVDDNWFEGKIANRKGIFPVSYVEVLIDIGSEDYSAPKTIITSSSITNMRPSLDALRTNINHEFNTLTQNGHQHPNGILRETRNMQKTDVLHVDTSTNPIAYRALYKYRPQNSDELELQEGDIVHVLEKCDDGWFVGTSQRTGCFGTFPGNYVERA